MNDAEEPIYPDEPIMGESKENFTAAAKNAVETAEREQRLRVRPGESVTFKVIGLEVDVHGPIGEYRIFLGINP